MEKMYRNCLLCVLLLGFELFLMVQGQIWTRMPRLCQRISGRDSQIWCKTDDHNLWRWVWGLDDWQWVQADTMTIQNVAVGFDDSVWVVNFTGGLHRMLDWTWSEVNATAENVTAPLHFTQVTALDEHEALALDVNLTIWHYYKGNWMEFGGPADYIAVGKDASFWSVFDGKVSRWNDTDWVPLPATEGGPRIKYIDVYDSGRIVATDEQWRLYMFISQGERFLSSYTIDPAGPRWRLLQQPFPNCAQAIFTKLHMWCVSDNGFINRSR